MEKNKKSQKTYETAVLGGGCFWCLEAAYRHIRGVKEAISGYAGGTKSNPTYKEVSSGATGHAETVKIAYDSNQISYADILQIFFSLHDPTTLNRQGNDIGTQYRSIILYANESQKQTAKKIIADLTQQKLYADPIVTELVPLDKFYPAEEYHQKYFEKNPEKAYCQIVINFKLAKLKEKFREYYQS